MRRAILLASLLGAAAMGLGLTGPALADSLSIGVQTNNLNLGINIGPTPFFLVAVPAPVVVAPGPSLLAVYTAPSLPYNYFVYRKVYYFYRQGYWFRACIYRGLWTVISIAQVPRPVLSVPVEHYKERPPHWEHHGPPPWKHEQERERHEKHGHGHGNEHERDRD